MTPPRPRRRLLRGLLVLAITGLLTLLLAEAGLRLFWNPPAIAELQSAGMYRNAEPGAVELLPGYRGRLRVGSSGRDTAVAINALGMRGPAVADRRPGERRVLCLGDSMVFGYGVESEATFAAQLQDLLAARLPGPVTVGNAGVPGYGTRASARQLARMLPRFQPDLILFAIYLGNDFMDDRKTDFSVEAGLMFEGAWARLFRRSLRAKIALRSRLCMFVETTLIAQRSRFALQPLPTPDEVAAFDGFPSYYAEPFQTHAGLFLDAIDEQRRWSGEGPPVLPRLFADLRAALAEAQQHAGHLPLHVLILPTLWHLQDDRRRQTLQALGMDPAEYRPGLAQERIARVCADLGLPVHDVTGWFRPDPDPETLFLAEDMGHFTPRGHRIVAERLAEVVADRLR